MRQQDIRRIQELLHQSADAGASIEDIIRRILTEMPHISPSDIQQVALVHAEELQQDSSVLTASAKASKTIAGILDETRRMSRMAEITTQTAIEILGIRAEQGDKRAAELLNDFNRAALFAGLDE